MFFCEHGNALTPSVMIIFINDIPVRILKANEQPDLGKVNVVIDTLESPLTQAQLIHHVWIKNVEDEHLNFARRTIGCRSEIGIVES